MSSVERHSVLYAQNFLHSPRLVERLLDRSGIGHDDLIYEIGPGRGIITEQLARRCRRVVAVEKDPALAARLTERFAGMPNVTIRGGDFLRVPLPPAPYKVFANIPFNATADIVARLTEPPCQPDDAFLVVQREAAERFRAVPRATLCGVLLHPWFETTITHRFKRDDFVPAPSVDIVMLRLRKRGPPLLGRADTPLFRDLVTYLFTAWQPTVHMSLKHLLGHGTLRGIERRLALDLDVPPSSIPPDHWLSLFHCLRHTGEARAWQRVSGSERRLKRQQATLHKRHRTHRAYATIGSPAPSEPARRRG